MPDQINTQGTIHQTSEQIKGDPFEQYEVSPEDFWELAHFYGDGYEVMEQARLYGWRERASWGMDGYDLGSWPYVVIYFRDFAAFEVAQYVEGDMTTWSCPTKEIREQITDGIAFFYWKSRDEAWVKGYDTVEALPPELRGPYRSTK